jgi:hypothetical protein
MNDFAGTDVAPGGTVLSGVGRGDAGGGIRRAADETFGG